MSDELLQTRAMFMPGTVDAEARTVEVVWTTGARVARMDFSGPYMEELSMDPSHVRMERLNNGAPLLSNHNSFELSAQIGVVERAWIDGGEGRALVRFSARPEVQPIFQDVKDGIIRNVSVGYRKWKVENTSDGETTVKRAIDWEPYELSLVPIPADAGAQIRSEESINIETETEPSKDSPMDENRMQEQSPAEAPGAEARAAVTIETPAVDAQAILAGERRRVADINDAVRKAGLELSFAEKLVADGTDINAARALIIDAMHQREKAAPTHTHVQVTADHAEKRAEAMSHALEARCGLRGWDEGGAREYLGVSLLQMGQECLERSGVNWRGMSKSDVALRAMHSTSDFPILLSNIQRKTLKAAYAEEQQTWRPIATQRNLPDFRPVYEVEVGGLILPEALAEGGEYKTATLQEQQGSWKLATYAKKLIISRQLIVNDDLGFIQRGIQMIGRGVSVFESNMMWALITGNAKISADNKALFHNDHKNQGTGAISEASMSAARKAMRNQKDFTGLNPINVAPRYALIPTTLETAFQKFLSPIQPTATGDVNVFSNAVQTIVEPRLDANSETAWYLAGTAPGVDLLVYGYLEGEAGPQIDSEVERDPDGVVTRVRLDFGCTVPQYQGFYKSTGA